MLAQSGETEQNQQAHKARLIVLVNNRRANNRTVRSARLLGLLAQTAGTGRTARISVIVEK